MPRKLPDLLKNVDELPAVKSKYISRLPCIAAFCGHTGSGKTYLAVSQIHMLIKEGSINRLYIISPTCRQNPLLRTIYKADNPAHYMFEDCSAKVFETLRFIENDMNSQAEQYADALAYQAAYKRYRAGETVSDSDAYTLEMHGYRVRTAIRPKALLILDDVQSTAVLSSRQANPFTNLVIKSRWVGQGLGLSIMMLTQSYKAHAIPRALRLNLTHLAVFRTESREELKNMYAEVGSLVPYDRFIQLYDAATLKPHGYMYVDFIRKTITDSF